MRKWWQPSEQKLDVLIALVTAQGHKLDQLLAQGSKEMATIADVQAAVAAEQTVDASVVTLLGQLSTMLQAAIASNDPAALQSIVDSLTTEQSNLAAAVAANTPASSPTPTPTATPMPTDPPSC